MQFNLGNSTIGQYETPYTINKFMAEINFLKIELPKKIANNNLMTLLEPCCGNGGMIIYTPFYLNGMHFKQDEFRRETVIETNTQLKLFEAG